MTLSCEEDLAKKNAKKKTDFASQVVYNANILQKDSGKITIRFRAPLMEKYEYIDTPYIEAKKGIQLEFFDKKFPKKPGKITANYAKMVEKKDFYMAKGNVKIVNPEGRIFKMQSIFWDKKDRQLYTKDTVYITETDGSIFVAKGGMRAKDDFSEYTFYNSNGDFNSKKLPSSQR